MYYDKDKKSFSTPPIFVHPISKEEFLKNIQNQIDHLSQLKDSGKFQDEDLKQIESALHWFKNIPNNYPGVDHWKIPYPIFHLPSL